MPPDEYPRRAAPIGPFEARCRKEKERPFLDQQPMVGDPSCAWKDFRPPLLRACSLQGDIEWRARLGHGIDGVVWKVRIGDGTFALKVFWDHEPPGGYCYWAVQRECHNAALLQMIEAAVNKSTEPICLKSEPEGFEGAMKNLHAFSDEGRLRKRYQDRPDATAYSSTPRLRQCFGWRKVSGDDLSSLPRRLLPPEVKIDQVRRYFERRPEYYAIVYEYIPESKLVADEDAMKRATDFLGRAGFDFVPFREENWLNGVLLDMSDLLCPWHASWSRSRVLSRLRSV